MNLQFGLAIVDQMNGSKETRQRMDGWMNQESKVARQLRTAGAKTLVALAARLAPIQDIPTVETTAASAL